MSSDVGSIEDLEIVAYEGYQIEDVQELYRKQSFQ